MRILTSAVFLLLLLNICQAQEFGGNPPSLKWRQINTDTARVIFPEGMDSAALRVASVVHFLAAQKPVSLGDRLKKINIVLQNQTTVPNAYVGLGPFRSEFFLTPDADNLGQGSIAWVDQLAIHEYRHVQQFNNFNNGLSHLMKILSGEDGYSLAINASIPDWFYEGDAVYNETILSRQGRGRLPHFTNAYPALWQAGKNYSWMKLRNGSLKDYVPNHYFLGYLLVNYGREKYGNDFWTKVTRDASAFKGLLYPFQVAIKKYAGVEYDVFRKQAFEYYKNLVPRVSQTREDYLFPVKKNYVTNYYFPYFTNGDSLIYLRSDYRHRPAFYIHSSQGERLLKIRAISIDEQYSYRNGKIVYSAYETDPRWNWKDFSVIHLLDINSGEDKIITHRSKYFTPDISPAGDRIAAIHNGTDGKSRIDILDISTGKIIQSIQSAEITLFTDPKFIDDNKLVTAVRLKDGRMCLALAEISSGNTSRLSLPSFNVVGFPAVEGDMIYFTASYGGNDDIYSVQLSTQKVKRISHGPLGNYYVTVKGSRIAWSSFTAEGYQLKTGNLDSIPQEEMTNAQMASPEPKFPVARETDTSSVLASIPFREFPVSKYSKGTNLFNFHSWRPYYSDPVFTYSLYGENVLNTLQSEIYYSYNRDEHTNAVGISEWYGALFPYLNLGVEYSFDRNEQIGSRTRQWGQLDSRIGVVLPLHFTSGRSFKNFSAGTYYVLRNEFNKGFYKDSLGNTSYSYLLHTLTWSQQVQRATQHFYPRFGYSLNLNHRYAISSVKGYQFLVNAALYLPGILSNHNIIFSGAFQQIDTLRQVSFSNLFPYSRGYVGRYFSRMWKLSANYHLPLFYPDWGFANILYIQSIRLNAFYDFTKVYSRNKQQTRNQRSVGGEIFFDTKWWNQYPLTFGFRTSRLLDQDQYDGFKGWVYEIVLPVSILPR